MCRPERLLELSHRFILFDAGEKKVARYQQYLTVKRLLSRIRERDGEGRRKGGVVWHTQGSGKSLTMVMFAKSLALEPGLHNHRIVLVTDRIDLDERTHTPSFYRLLSRSMPDWERRKARLEKVVI